MGPRSAFLVAVLTVAACHSEHNAADVDSAVMPDTPDGTGCTDLTPRLQPVETFVGPTGLETRMGALIDGAQTSLDVQMYLFTVTSLADKIVAATQRGVAVRVILDPDEPGNNNVEPIFTSGGVTWKNASMIYSYSHAKYLIVDRSIAVIMSMNFNADAMRIERNYGMVDRDPEDIADVQAIFDQDWALANGQPAQPANLTCTRLIVSPTNSKQRLLDLIASAQSSLDVEVLYLSETTIRTAVVAAKQRGAAVRVIVSDPTDTSIPALKSAGIPVKTPGSAFYLHAKLIMADQVAFVGSENMSYTSFEKNREVGALAFEPAAFAPIKQQFESDWVAAMPVP